MSHCSRGNLHDGVALSFVPLASARTKLSIVVLLSVICILLAAPTVRQNREGSAALSPGQLRPSLQAVEVGKERMKRKRHLTVQKDVRPQRGSAVKRVKRLNNELRQLKTEIEESITELKSVSQDLRKLDKQIQKVDSEIDWVLLEILQNLTRAERPGNGSRALQLRDTEKQLRDKEKQLREEKKQLLDKEKQLQDKEKQLQDKEKQLREERSLHLQQKQPTHVESADQSFSQLLLSAVNFTKIKEELAAQYTSRSSLGSGLSIDKFTLENLPFFDPKVHVAPLGTLFQSSGIRKTKWAFSLRECGMAHIIYLHVGHLANTSPNGWPKQQPFNLLKWAFKLDGPWSDAVHRMKVFLVLIMSESAKSFGRQHPQACRDLVFRLKDDYAEYGQVLNGLSQRDAENCDLLDCLQLIRECNVESRLKLVVVWDEAAGLVRAKFDVSADFGVLHLQLGKMYKISARPVLLLALQELSQGYLKLAGGKSLPAVATS